MHTFAITYFTALSQPTTTVIAAAAATTTTTYDDNHRLAFNQSASRLSSLVDECIPKNVGLEEEQQQLYVNLSTFWYCFLALITTIGLLISLISNMIIIYLFTSTPFLRKNPSNIIAVNLSLSDLLYCVQWPSVIYCSLTQSTWILDHSFVCQSFGFITVSTALASILTVLAMSIERAIVIIYSIHARNKFTIRLAWMITVLIWIVSLLSCLPPLFGKFNRYTLDPSKTSCTLDYLSRQANYKLYIMILYVGYWIVPTILITISYITIIVTFKKSTLDLKKISGESHASSANRSAIRGPYYLGRKLRDSLRLKGFASNLEHSKDTTRTRFVLQFRLAKMSFYLILLWLVSWTPIASLAMINSVTKCPRASATAVFLASTMTKLGPALDVFIYGISHPKIKSRFKQIIRRLLFLNCSGSHNIELSSN